MKFWEKHSEEMRKARLLQAAALIFSSTRIGGGGNIRDSVNLALQLETEVEKQTKEKHS